MEEVIDKPVLYYFDLFGRAESMRILFHVGKVDYEDKRIPIEKWGELKESGKFEYGQMPGLDIDGHTLVQSLAILKYLGISFFIY
jgi:glutathione S-transferase